MLQQSNIVDSYPENIKVKCLISLIIFITGIEHHWFLPWGFQDRSER